MIARRSISFLVAKAQDPAPETPPAEPGSVPRQGWGWRPMLAVIAALGLFALAYGYSCLRLGGKAWNFYSGLVFF
jgi:hypothetical protein